MKISRVLLFVSVARLAAGQNPTEFAWSDSCNDLCQDVFYDHCGELEFCERSGGYGYMQNGVCSAPGPLIRIESSKKYLLSLKNTVGVATNLHTHGLHISGDGNHDDITRVVETTNNCLHYNWNPKPHTQSSGTYWYHAHVHGHTEEQVRGGALGMLVVDDVVGNVQAGVRVVPSTCTNRENIETFLKNEKQIVAAKLGNTWTGNGNSAGASIEVKRSEWTRFRIAVSDPGGGTGLVQIVAPSKRDPTPWYVCKPRK